jgi:hypothetical protein
MSTNRYNIMFVSQDILSVSYLPYPKFTNNNQIINKTSFENKFALNMNVFAGPRINATIYFKDHTE